MIDKASISGADLVKLQFADVDTDYDQTQLPINYLKSLLFLKKIFTKFTNMLNKKI